MPSRGSSGRVRGVLRPELDWGAAGELSARDPMSSPAVETHGQAMTITHTIQIKQHGTQIVLMHTWRIYMRGVLPQQPDHKKKYK